MKREPIETARRDGTVMRLLDGQGRERLGSWGDLQQEAYLRTSATQDPFTMQFQQGWRDAKTGFQIRAIGWQHVNGER